MGSVTSTQETINTFMDLVDNDEVSVEDLIRIIAKSLVDKPDKVQTSMNDGMCTTVVDLVTDPEDTGKIIGRGGRTASALRTLVFAISSKRNRKTILEIIDQRHAMRDNGRNGFGEEGENEDSRGNRRENYSRSRDNGYRQNSRYPRHRGNQGRY